MLWVRGECIHRRELDKGNGEPTRYVWMRSEEEKRLWREPGLVSLCVFALES